MQLHPRGTASSTATLPGEVLPAFSVTPSGVCGRFPRPAGPRTRTTAPHSHMCGPPMFPHEKRGPRHEPTNPAESAGATGLHATAAARGGLRWTGDAYPPRTLGAGGGVG